MKLKFVRSCFFAAALVGLSACTDSPSEAPGNNSGSNFSSARSSASAVDGPSASAPFIISAGLGGASEEAVWVSGRGFAAGCSVSIFKPDWSGNPLLATLTGSQVNCLGNLVTFAVPSWIRAQFSSINVNVSTGERWSNVVAVSIVSTSFLERFELSDSGHRYSSLVGMYARLASSSPTAGALAWSNSDKTATVHYNNAGEYYEVFEGKGDWMTLTGWGGKGPGGADLYYQIVTTRAVFSTAGRNYDITPQFAGGGHPYALERLPTADYEIYVEASLVEFANWVPTGAKMTFSWTVAWGAPKIHETIYFGLRLGILQSERWIDSAGNDSTQAQVICDGVGYACWRQGALMTEPDGTSAVWTW